MLIEARDRVGENAITREDGQAIYDIIHPALQNGDRIELDFEGVRVFASPFLNAAIGQLLKDVSPEQLNRQLDILHMSRAGRSTLRVVIETAKNHYADTEKAAEIDEIVAQELSAR